MLKAINEGHVQFVKIESKHYPCVILTNGNDQVALFPTDGTFKLLTKGNKVEDTCDIAELDNMKLVVDQQGAFSVSELWTTAKFASADNSLSFAEAKNKNFRVGDWIKIGWNGANKSMHLNLKGNANRVGGTNQGEQTFITAKIIEYYPQITNAKNNNNSCRRAI